MNKATLRKIVKERLKAMTESDYVLFSEKIKKQLLESEEWLEAKTIGITISTGHEVETTNIIKEAWQQQKQIVVPKCFPEKKELRFYQIDSFDQVEESFYSLKEPIISRTSCVPKENIDLLVVPGIIFDIRGFRIGYGGGYFDRYLTDYKNKTISLAFQFQIFEEIPTEPHDIAVQKIISN